MLLLQCSSTRALQNVGVCTGLTLAGLGPNATPRHWVPLSNGVITSPSSVSHVITFLIKIF